MSTAKIINISEEILCIIHEISQTFPSFSHIDTNRIFVCVSSNRNGRGGTFGKLVPLRFKDGAKIIKHNQKYYSSPLIVNDGIEMLYVIYFYLPKFFDLPPLEKLRVIFHELFHISPSFNGDIRRMGDVKIAHGSSRKKFDDHFDDELMQYFESIKANPKIDFLKMDCNTLFSYHSKVFARRMKAPKPTPIH